MAKAVRRRSIRRRRRVARVTLRFLRFSRRAGLCCGAVCAGRRRWFWLPAGCCRFGWFCAFGWFWFFRLFCPLRALFAGRRCLPPDFAFFGLLPAGRLPAGYWVVLLPCPCAGRRVWDWGWVGNWMLLSAREERTLPLALREGGRLSGSPL